MIRLLKRIHHGNIVPNLSNDCVRQHDTYKQAGIKIQARSVKANQGLYRLLLFQEERFLQDL